MYRARSAMVEAWASQRSLSINGTELEGWVLEIFSKRKHEEAKYSSRMSSEKKGT